MCCHRSPDKQRDGRDERGLTRMAATTDEGGGDIEQQVVSGSYDRARPWRPRPVGLDGHHQELIRGHCVKVIVGGVGYEHLFTDIVRNEAAVGGR